MTELDGDTVFVLYLHCTEVYDNQSYTKVLRILKREYRPSIRYLRKLIERELDIPRVCQLSLSVAGVPMDPIETMEECCLSHRLLENPNPITLQYYTTCLNLEKISNILEQIKNDFNQNKVLSFCTHIETLTRFVSQVSWTSKEVVGIALFFVGEGFIQKLKRVLIHLNTSSERLLNQNETIDSNVQIEGIMKCLSSILNFFWRLGGIWELLVFMLEQGMVDEFLRTFLIANNELIIKSMPHRSNILKHNCNGIFQVMIELKKASLKLGTDQQFLLILKETLIGKRQVWKYFDYCLISVIIYSLSYLTVPSIQLANTGVYTELINYCMDFSDCNMANVNYVRSHYYNVGMAILNALRTPNLYLCCDFPNNASRFLQGFLQNVSISQMVKDENDHSVVWEVMESFVAFFFIPTNSILGRIRVGEGSDVSEIVDRYYRMAFFVLEVLLRQETHRNKIMDCNVLDLLVVAHWRTHGSTSIYNMLRIYFPHLVYYPVPSLHDIAAVSAFCAGLGDFSDLICS